VCWWGEKRKEREVKVERDRRRKKGVRTIETKGTGMVVHAYNPSYERGRGKRLVHTKAKDPIRNELKPKELGMWLKW
jgi:hypothetical protein